MKFVAWLVGVGTLVMAAMYMVISLNRWEYDRAMFYGLIVIIAEVALATGLVLRKLGARDAPLPDPDPTVLTTMQANRPPSPNRFAWMETNSGRTNVFITFLVGGGIILSGIAWLVDRVAARTITPLAEESLAHSLQAIAYPHGGLLLDDVTVLAQAVPGCDNSQLERLLRRAGHGRL